MLSQNNQFGLGPRSFGLVLFALFWSKIWGNFTCFRNSSAQIAKLRSLFHVVQSTVRNRVVHTRLSCLKVIQKKDFVKIINLVFVLDRTRVLLNIYREVWTILVWLNGWATLSGLNKTLDKMLTLNKKTKIKKNNATKP